MWHGESGGHGLSTQSSVRQVLIGCLGGVIAGLIEIGTESLGIVRYRDEPGMGTLRKTACEPL
jgi:hypothetical protein